MCSVHTPRSTWCVSERLATCEGRWRNDAVPSRPPPRCAHSASWPNFEDHYLTAIKTEAAPTGPVAICPPQQPANKLNAAFAVFHLPAAARPIGSVTPQSPPVYLRMSPQGPAMLAPGPSRASASSESSVRDAPIGGIGWNVLSWQFSFVLLPLVNRGAL